MQPVDLLLVALILLAAGLAVRSAWRRRGRCCGDCGSCAGCTAGKDRTRRGDAQDPQVPPRG